MRGTTDPTRISQRAPHGRTRRPGALLSALVSGVLLRNEDPSADTLRGATDRHARTDATGRRN